jgi:tripartite-type tricarboxylate transporter receptor subunit TctC
LNFSEKPSTKNGDKIMQRRSFLHCGAAGAATLLAGPAMAKAVGEYPEKAVRFIVPTPPGNALDAGARILADHLGKTWTDGVFIDNRAGGMGLPGMMAAKNAPADGYTVLIGASAFLAINPALISNISYDVHKDYQLVSGLFTVGMALVTHTKTGFKTLDDVLRHAKNSNVPVNIGYGGNPGTTQHIAAEMLVRRAGISATLVPYKGSAPAMTDLIGGQIPLLIDSIASVNSQIRGGRIHAIAVAAPARAPQLPDVPTFAEAGLADFSALAWGGVMVPAATPKAVVDRLTADISAVLALPEVEQRMASAGLVVDRRDSKEWTDFVKAESKKYAEVIRAANITPP